MESNCESTSSKVENVPRNRESSRDVSKNKAKSVSLFKHVFLGSVVALLLGGFSKYYFSGKYEFQENLSGIINDNGIINDVKTKRIFGEEIKVDNNDESMTISLNDLSSSQKEDGFEEEDEEEHIDNSEELDLDEEESDNEQIDDNIKRLLQEDVTFELDEGFSTKGKDEGVYVDVNDDAEVEEYENEVDNLIDNNWSDDEAELIKYEKEKNQA